MSSAQHSTAYRADIDGLRAIAVVSVILFHALPGALPGGFTGVDIFFVISGYLISGIIFAQADAGRFRYRDFYLRRVRRIFPALAVVLAATLLFGSLVLFAREYKSLGLQTLSAAAFCSNLQFWYNSGYFDRAAATKPLLHLWSLGVEEQFYLLWPPLILLARRRRHLLLLMLAVAAASFAYCLYSTAHSATSAYFLPMSRFWELMLGALLAHARLCGWRFTALRPDAQSVLGLLLIAAGLLLVRPSSPFPGWRALLPTLGAALLIHAGSGAVVNRTLLANRAVVAVGLISYPLYLWHWPLLSYLYLLRGGVVPVRMAVVAVGFAVLLAVLTYLLLERPVRESRPSGNMALALASLVLLLGVAGGFIYQQQGLPGRAVNRLNVSDNDTADATGLLQEGCGLSAAERPGIAVCQQDRREPPTVALLGDSKAQALFPALVTHSAPGARWLLIGGHSKQGVSPVPVLTEDPAWSANQPITRAALAALMRNSDLHTVVLVSAARNLLQTEDRYGDDLSASPHYVAAAAGLQRVLVQLTGAGKRVVIVVDNPALEDPELCMTRQTSVAWMNRMFRHAPNPHCSLAIAEQDRKTAAYRAMLQHAAGPFGGAVEVLDLTGSLCDLAAGSCAIRRDGHMLYSYSDHVSQYGADLLAGPIEKSVQEGVPRAIDLASRVR